VLAAFLVLGVAGASALQTHLLQSTFRPPEGFAVYGPRGVAVDQSSGAVYVSDAVRGAVYVFDADGIAASPPRLTETDGVTPAVLAAPKGVAVDNSAGATKGYVYVANAGTGAVQQFDASGAVTGQAPITAASVPADGTPQSGALPNVVNNGSLTLTGVATDSAGNVYVADSGNEVIDVFTSGGSFVSQLGAGVISSPNWVAVDPTGNVYVTSISGLMKLSPSGKCLNSCNSLDAGGIAGVATDAAGHVYVAEYTEIHEFDSAGDRVAIFATPTRRPRFKGVGFVSGVAVNSSSGEIYVTDLIPFTFGNAAGRFGPRVTVPAATTGAAESVTPISATLEGTVEPEGEAVTECEFEYGTTPAYGQSAPCAESPASLGVASTPVPVHADVTGLDPGSPYYFRLSAGNANGAGAFLGSEFSTPPAVDITPEAATENAGRSIRLNALVNNRSSALTACAFEYVTEAGFEAGGGSFSSLSTGGSVPCDPAAGSIPADGVDHPVSAQLTNLVGNTTYRYRITASSGNGTSTVEGPEFTTAQTPPIVTTAEATELEASSARLRGFVNPAGLQTTYYFQYGTSTAYGSKVPAAEGVAGKGRFATEVGRTVTDLQPSTTYHFRLVGVNSVGTEAGADATFTTPQPIAEPGRAYELVSSSANRGGGDVEPQAAFQASPDGSSITYLRAAPVAGEPAGTVPLLPRYAAYRTPGGWIDKAVDFPQITAVQPGPTELTVGVSEDGTKAVVLSRKRLTPDAVKGDWNVYMRDLLTGSYEKMASTPDLRFGEEAGAQAQVFVQGTPNFDHVLLRGEGIGFLGGAPGGAMYDFTGGELHLVSTDPGETPIETAPYDTASHDKNLISEDGERIVYRGGPEASVYLRSEGVTRLLSVSHRTVDAGTPHWGVLLGGDAELRYVYFFSRELTDDSSDPEATYLYRYDTSSGQLTSLAEVSREAEEAEPMQVSADGSSVFWATASALTPDANAAPSHKHLYVWRDDVVRQIADLDQNIDAGSAPTRTYWTSPNGRYFVFTAGSPDIVPGVDPENVGQCSDPAIGDLGYCRMMYRYDVDTDAMVCASCAPGGGTPTSSVLASEASVESGWRSRPRLVDDRGDVFFDSRDQLVAGDSNAAGDVYEYGDASGLRLVSAGQGPGDSDLAEIGADGRDVFFTTSDRLVREDVDDSVDLYDARRGGGIPSQNAVPSCGEGGCRAQLVPPAPPAASETTIGPRKKPIRKGRCAKNRHNRQHKGKGKGRCAKKDKPAEPDHRRRHHSSSSAGTSRQQRPG
jgi:hypothetical protein